jgi:molybdopterin converting factor small subunit
MPTVEVPPPYRGPTRGEGIIEVSGGSVRECIATVDARYPGFARQIFDAEGGVHRFVRLFLNGSPIEADGLDKPIAERDVVGIIAAIGGG